MRKRPKLTLCKDCAVIYAMDDNCPLCVYSGRWPDIRIMSIKGGAVHNWYGNVAHKASCQTPFKGRPVYLPPNTVVTCTFCNPLIANDLFKTVKMHSKQDRKLAKPLPKAEDVANYVLKNEFFRRAHAPFSQVGACPSDGGDLQLAGRDHQLRKVGKAYRVDEGYEGEGM